MQLEIQGKSLLKHGAQANQTWQSQDDFMAALVSEKLDDCLSFDWPAYLAHDWDNIPPVVPRYIVQLAKYMEGVTAVVKVHEKAEKTAALRKDMEQRVKALDGAITRHDELNRTEHSALD